MTILIPIAILGVLVTAVGYYFATHEGQLQQAKSGRPDDVTGVRLPMPSADTSADPTAAGAEQPVRGVPLHS
jgi:hypothetical protein